MLHKAELNKQAQNRRDTRTKDIHIIIFIFSYVQQITLYIEHVEQLIKLLPTLPIGSGQWTEAEAEAEAAAAELNQQPAESI